MANTTSGTVVFDKNFSIDIFLAQNIIGDLLYAPIG